MNYHDPGTLSIDDDRTTFGLVRSQFGNQKRCTLAFSAMTEIGPNADLPYQGVLSFSVKEDGAIDDGELLSQDGESLSVVGQATGRSLRLRIGLGGGGALSLTGSAAEPVDQCIGEFLGAFGGPAMQDIGVWSAVKQQTE